MHPAALAFRKARGAEVRWLSRVGRSPIVAEGLRSGRRGCRRWIPHGGAAHPPTHPPYSPSLTPSRSLWRPPCSASEHPFSAAACRCVRHAAGNREGACPLSVVRDMRMAHGHTKLYKIPSSKKFAARRLHRHPDRKKCRKAYLYLGSASAIARPSRSNISRTAATRGPFWRPE